jgi:ferredoxin
MDPGIERWLTVNAQYAKIWPNITTKKEAPADAKEWENVPDKFARHFSSKPGKGD